MKILLINPPFEEKYSVGEPKSIKGVLNVIQPVGLVLKQEYKFNFRQPCNILDHSALLYIPEGISKSDYRKFLDSAFKRFYLRPSYILRRFMSIRTWDEFKGQVNGFFSMARL